MTNFSRSATGRIVLVCALSAMLYGAWIGITVVLTLVLAGGIF